MHAQWNNHLAKWVAECDQVNNNTCDPQSDCGIHKVTNESYYQCNCEELPAAEPAGCHGTIPEQGGILFDCEYCAVQCGGTCPTVATCTLDDLSTTTWCCQCD